MSNPVSGDLIVAGDGQFGPFVARQLQNYKGKAQLENDLQGYETTKCIVVSLFRGGKEMCNQGNSYEPSCARPKPCHYGECDGLIKSKHLPHPRTDTRN